MRSRAQGESGQTPMLRVRHRPIQIPRLARMDKYSKCRRNDERLRNLSPLRPLTAGHPRTGRGRRRNSRRQKPQKTRRRRKPASLVGRGKIELRPQKQKGQATRPSRGEGGHGHNESQHRRGQRISRSRLRKSKCPIYARTCEPARCPNVKWSYGHLSELNMNGGSAREKAGAKRALRSSHPLTTESRLRGTGRKQRRRRADHA